MIQVRAAPVRAFSRDFELSDGSAGIGEARLAMLPSRAVIKLRGAEYSVDRIGLLRPEFELRRGGATVNRLVPSGFMRYRVEGLDRTVFMRAAGPFWRHYVLEHGDRGLATLRPERLFGRAALVDFEESIPEAAAAFLLITSILLWRRRARRARS